MSQKEILTNGNAFKRTDGRWGGVVWYKDEQGERKRKSFSGTTKTEVNQKMKNYIVEFNRQKNDSVESLKTLQESMQNWLQVFKFPSVERSTYDRLEATAKNQIFPVLGKKVVGDITAADIKKLLNRRMTEGYAFTTVKKVHNLLNEYFRYLYQQDIIVRNPMANVEMIKKANFMSAQGKENLPPTDTITVFTEEELKKFKAEAFSVFSNGKRKYQQAAVYILMLNTGLRTGEALGLLNSDVDLEHRVLHIQRGVKEISKRSGVTAERGREVAVGKLKSATSKRDVPLNDTAIEMIKDLRSEFYFGEDSPLIPDEHGEVTRPVNFRKRYYRILKAAGIEIKGLHSFRHTFATRLINGTKDKNGKIKSLTPRQVADLLGHTTSEITELYYVKRDMKMLTGITDGFEL